jgi:hypothetical protein
LGTDVDSWAELIDGEHPVWTWYLLYSFIDDYYADRDATLGIDNETNGWNPMNPTPDLPAEAGGETEDYNYDNYWSSTTSVPLIRCAEPGGPTLEIVKGWLEASYSYAVAFGRDDEYRTTLYNMCNGISIKKDWGEFYEVYLSNLAGQLVKDDETYRQLVVFLSGFFFPMLQVYPELTYEGLIDYLELNSEDYIP